MDFILVYVVFIWIYYELLGLIHGFISFIMFYMVHRIIIGYNPGITVG